MLLLSIYKELERIPQDKRAELYDIIHYFRLGLETKEKMENPTMELAGSWSDMPDRVFDLMLEDITERRKKAFTGRRGHGTSTD